MCNHYETREEAEAVRIQCRQCNHVMQTDAQEKPRGGFFPIVTCWNKSCDLHGVTASANNYPGKDVSSWLTPPDLTRKRTIQVL